MVINNKKISVFYSEFIKNIIWISVILLLLDVYSYFFVDNQYLRDLFNFASEKTPATWIASILFIVIGFSLFLISLIKKRKKWIFFGYFFLYLSFDDATYFHEQISSWLSEQFSYISGLPSYGWLYTIAPIIFIFLAIFFYNLYFELKKEAISKKYLFLSIFLLSVAVSLDFIDGLFVEGELNIIVTHYFRVAEEFIEILSFALLLLSMSHLIDKYINIKKGKNYEKT